MINTLRILLFCLSLSMLLSACGGGGGGSTPAAPPTKVTVKLATSGTLPQGSTIGAIGTTIKYATNKGLSVTADNVLSSGAASGSTLAANTNTGGEIIIGNIAGSGFGVGEFATLTFTIAPANSPLASDFTVAPNTTSIFASDATTDLSGLLTVIIQSVTFQ